jgi:hypothetical protein
MSTTTKTFHQHAACLKHYGFQKIEEITGKNPTNAKIKSALLTTKWTHPKFGTITVKHIEHTFMHEGESTDFTPTGKNNVTLERYLTEAASQRQEASGGAKKKKTPKKVKASKKSEPELAPEGEPVTAAPEAE